MTGEKLKSILSGLMEICGVLLVLGMLWLFMLFGHALGLG